MGIALLFYINLTGLYLFFSFLLVTPNIFVYYCIFCWQSFDEVDDDDDDDLYTEVLDSS
jgi:hypothetical protein